MEELGRLPTILAVWGAALSTLLAIVRLMDFIRDRVRVQVRVKGGYHCHPKDPHNPDGTYITISVVNKGRRPVKVSSAALMKPKGFEIDWVVRELLSEPKPYLQEGQSHSFKMLEDDIGFGSDQYVAFIEDASGKRYYSHKLPVRWWRLRRIRKMGRSVPDLPYK